MSDSYTKLFESITDSTIWAAPDTTRLVWITMLAMSDQHGYIGASIPGLASRARVSLDDCVAAIDAFLLPDKWSRTPDFEGRRIAVADGGWLLLNHAKYRAIMDKDTRRERARVAMAELRSKRKGANNVSNVSNVSSGDQSLPQADTDTDTDKKKNTAPDGFDVFYKAYPKKVARPGAEKAFKAQKINGEIPAILADIENRLNSGEWVDSKEKRQYIPHPATYLNERRWEDESAPSEPSAWAGAK